MNTVEKKIKGLQALLGVDAAKVALTEAENREKAAIQAGVDFKETRQKEGEDDKVKSPTLSHILEQIETGLDQGWIVDDVDTSEEAGSEAVASGSAPVAEVDLEAMGKEIAGYVDTAVKEATDGLRTELAALRKEVGTNFMPRHKERDVQMQALQKEMQETGERQKEIQGQMAELLGLRPNRANGYRPSQDEGTVTTKEANTQVQAQPDPVGAFIEQIFDNPNAPAF